MSYPFDCADPAGRRRGLDAAVAAVHNEQLVVLPVESAYGVACDAFSVDAVADLLEFKGDPARRPPAVLVPNARTIEGLAADVPDAARALAEAFWPGLLTLVCTQQPTLRWDLGDNRGTVSLRMPVHPLALELLTRTGPLALTTAAPSDAGPEGLRVRARPRRRLRRRLPRRRARALDRRLDRRRRAAGACRASCARARSPWRAAGGSCPDAPRAGGVRLVRAYLYLLLVAAAVTYVTTPLIRAHRPPDRRDHAGARARRARGADPADGGRGDVPRFRGRRSSPRARCRSSPASSRAGQPWGVLVGAFTVCPLGIADDVWQLDAVTKLAGQAIAAGLMAWKGVQLVSVPVLGVTIFSTGVARRAHRRHRARDDQRGELRRRARRARGRRRRHRGVRILRLLLPADDAEHAQDYSSVASMVTASLVGCCLGFLPHNFNPARIFMGDTGSMLIGLLLASATIEVTGQVDPNTTSAPAIAPAFFPLVLPFAVLALPLVDLGLAVVRRTRRGQMFWQPDKMHLHHRMLQLGHSHASAVLILYVWTATFAFGVAVMAFIPFSYGLLAGIVAVGLAAALTFGPLRRPRSSNRHAQ